MDVKIAFLNGCVEESIKDDEDISKAVEILSNLTTYQKILTK